MRRSRRLTRPTVTAARRAAAHGGDFSRTPTEASSLIVATRPSSTTLNGARDDELPDLDALIRQLGVQHLAECAFGKATEVPEYFGLLVTTLPPLTTRTEPSPTSRTGLR